MKKIILISVIALFSCNENENSDFLKSVDLIQKEQESNKQKYYDRIERDREELIEMALDYFKKVSKPLTRQEKYFIDRVDDIKNPRQLYYDKMGYYHLPDTHSSIRNFESKKTGN